MEPHASYLSRPASHLPGSGWPRPVCIALMLSALLLTACGGGSEAVVAGSPAVPAATAPVTPAATAPATPAATAPAAPAAAASDAPAITVQAVATAVGGPTGTPAGATIGAAGGHLAAADGRLSLDIPAGALAGDTVIGIQPLTNTAHGKRGATYRLTPDGQVFLKPVTLTFAYTDQDLLGTAAGLLGAAFQTREGFWQWTGDAAVDTAARTVSVATSHFTDFSLVAGLQLRPGKKVVKPGERAGLDVVECYPETVAGSGGSLVTLGNACDSDLAPVSKASHASDWSVNGNAGGGGVFGTVSGNTAGATYKAPATAPTPPTVAVSARVDRGSKGITLLVSNITIAQDSWTGTGSTEITTTSPFSRLSVKAEVVWTFERNDNNVVTYTPSGTATVTAFELDTCTMSPLTGLIDPSSDLVVGHGELVVDYNASPPTYHGHGYTGWTATVTCPQPFAPPFIYPFALRALYFGGPPMAQGTVSADGTTIKGNDPGPLLTAADWTFTRN